MMVAWHEVPGSAGRKVPSHRVRSGQRPNGIFHPDRGKILTPHNAKGGPRCTNGDCTVTAHTAPSGTDYFLTNSRHFVPG
jgi:hypothetical protein